MRWGHGICIACGKGGVGKTTTVANVGAFLAASQKQDGSDIRVLLVDVDAQADLTSQFGLSALRAEETLAGHIRRGANLENIIRTDLQGIKGLDIIASHNHLGFHDQEVTKFGRWLSNSLKEIRLRYDVILFDTPGDLQSIMVVNALGASDGVLIPTEAKRYSAEGLPLLLARCQQTFEDLGIQAPWARIVLTMIKPHSVERQWRTHIREQHPGVMDTEIAYNTAVEQAVTACRPLLLWDDTCQGFADYQLLAQEIQEYVERDCLPMPGIRLAAKRESAA